MKAPTPDRNGKDQTTLPRLDAFTNPLVYTF
jgi:hypothetical protein